MLRFKVLAATALALTVAACGGSSSSKEAKAPTDPSGKKNRSGMQVSKKAAAKFETALDAFIGYDKKQNWTSDTCEEVAGLFKVAGIEQHDATNRPFPEAIYNAGLAHQRCGDDEKARERFEAALEADPSFHRAKAQLALYQFQQTKDLDSAIASLDTVIRDAKFQNAEGLVALASLQMERGNGEEDLQAAKLNLQRALAINDGFMPAFNQLAIYYLEQAKAKASGGESKARRRGLVVSGAKGTDVNAQQLDLAALVASQAMQKNPFYAPIHNTAGLIQAELKNYNSAVQSFGKARKLDPTFFEAHMNYAAVNLSFRGFAEAEDAYKAALKLKPDTFEAHLGLALAIRGQMEIGNEKLLKEAEKHIAKARELEPTRPEPYYNEAILVQEFKAKGASEEESVKQLLAAANIYDDFVNRAGGEPAYEAAVKRAKDRAQDARDTADFIEQGKEIRVQEELAAKQRKAEEARKKKEEARLKKDEARAKKDEEKRLKEEADRQKKEEARLKTEESKGQTAEPKKADEKPKKADEKPKKADETKAK